MNHEWHEVMFNAKSDIFKMSCEISVNYFKRLEKLKKIRQSNGPGLDTLPIDNEKI
jgi:hypothetical protein